MQQLSSLSSVLPHGVFEVHGAPLRQLLLGGQKSGKSRHAELLARQWLELDSRHEACLIATGTAWDAEMQERIARHQRDRAERVPQLGTLEEARDVAARIAEHSAPHRLLIVDCLTLWLTNWLMPASSVTQGLESNQPVEPDWQVQAAHFLIALQQSSGPVLLVSNEIGLGVIPMGRDVRAFVDALGLLNQRTAAACNRVSFMAAGLPLQMK